jgi:hypothetical protein
MGKDHSGADSGSKPVDARVARRRQDPIGRRLRQMYDEVVGEDVPDDFLSFLEQADERSAGAKQSNGDGTENDEPAPKQRPVKTEP